MKTKKGNVGNKYLISWILVNSLGKLRFSRSSYYYLVIIPILVKLLEKINNPISLNFGGTDIQLNFELPFSWYLFYFGALAIAIGSIFYLIFCPEIIKKYKNYGEFLEAGESDNYLNQISEKYNISSSSLGTFERPFIEEKTTERIEIAPKSRFEKPTYEEYEKVTNYRYNIKYQEERKDTFNQIYTEVKHKNQPLIIIAFLFYLLGFIAFTWVIIQNIIFVIKHLF